jgi:hypothetical protein
MLKGTLLIFLGRWLARVESGDALSQRGPLHSGLRHGLRRHAFGLLEPDQQVRWLDLVMAHVAGSVLGQDDRVAVVSRMLACLNFRASPTSH